MKYQFEHEKIEKCTDCPLYNYDSYDPTCGYNAESVNEYDKPDWCPLLVKF